MTGVGFRLTLADCAVKFLEEAVEAGMRPAGGRQFLEIVSSAAGSFWKVRKMSSAITSPEPAQIAFNGNFRK